MLFILVLGTLMGALDSTIVILAFPVIAERLVSLIIACDSRSHVHHQREGSERLEG